MYVGLTCPTIEAARIVANTPVSYVLSRNIERSGCLFMALSGRIVDESEQFNIGNELFTFRTIATPDGTVYQLHGLGEGYVT